MLLSRGTTPHQRAALLFGSAFFTWRSCGIPHPTLSQGERRFGKSLYDSLVAGGVIRVGVITFLLSSIKTTGPSCGYRVICVRALRVPAQPVHLSSFCAPGRRAVQIRGRGRCSRG